MASGKRDSTKYSLLRLWAETEECEQKIAKDAKVLSETLFSLSPSCSLRTSVKKSLFGPWVEKEYRK